MTFRTTLITIVSVLFIAGYFLVDNWERTMENGDSSGYYFHVVSFFVNQDVGEYKTTIDTYLDYFPNAGDPREDIYGVRQTPHGKYYIKYTLGVGVMEIPAFAIAHAIATLSPQYAADGWSQPYIFWINFSKVIYILIGFFFLTKTLERYFSRTVVALTVLSVAFATNLFYHGTFLTLAHSFLFFDFCLLVYATIQFYEEPNKRKAVLIGALVGLIALTRVPEVVGLCIPLLWGVYNRETLRERFRFFRQHYHYLLLAGVALVVVFAPQLLYWYYTSGQLFFNPYQGETFNFLRPNIYRGWFDFQNGWLIYTPIMAFGLVGLFFLAKQLPAALLPAIGFVGLNSWIHYSYYVWNYFPGLGSRPMIDGYPLLAFGLAAFYTVCLQRNWTRYLALATLLFFTWLNLFQSWQMRKGIIWSERGNWPFYWETFGSRTPTQRSLIAYDSRRFQPDSSDLRLVDTLYATDFSDPAFAEYRDSTYAYSGKYSLRNTVEKVYADTIFEFREHDIQPGDWIYVAVKAYRSKEDMVWQRDRLENLVIEIRDETEEIQSWSSIKIASHIDNPAFSIWHAGTPGVWGKAAFYGHVPRNAKPDWRLSVHIWNEQLLGLYIDDFVILHYRPE